MRIKLIEDLLMASSAKLYQFNWVIEQLLVAPTALTYAAIVTAPSRGTDTGAAATAKPTSTPEIASRADFRVGTCGSFTDRNLQRHVGLIVRINQRTATLDCDGPTWRVRFGLLRPLVDT